MEQVVGSYLDGLAPWWSRAGVSCRRHVADGVGDAVVAPVTEVLGEVFSELVTPPVHCDDCGVSGQPRQCATLHPCNKKNSASTSSCCQNRGRQPQRSSNMHQQRSIDATIAVSRSSVCSQLLRAQPRIFPSSNPPTGTHASTTAELICWQSNTSSHTCASNSTAASRRPSNGLGKNRSLQKRTLQRPTCWRCMQATARNQCVPDRQGYDEGSAAKRSETTSHSRSLWDRNRTKQKACFLIPPRTNGLSRQQGSSR